MSIYLEKNKKTKKLIRETFLQLLKNKSFDTITVGDITQTAQINRGTFYLHFQDKYELLDVIETELFNDFGAYIDQLQTKYSSLLPYEEEQQQFAMQLFQFIEQRAEDLNIFLGSKGRAGFHIRFKQAFSEKVKANIIEQASYKEEEYAPIHYYISFITSAFLGLVEEWVQNDLKETPQQMTEIYRQIIHAIKR